MKLSVSVPDELWERASAQRPDLKTSVLVQEALESWTRPEGTAGYSLARPEGVEELFEAARERLAAEARAQFERGYRAALEAAPSLAIWHIESLAEKRYDVKAWIEPIVGGRVAMAVGQIPDPSPGEPDLAMVALIRALGSLSGPWADDMFRPGPAYLRGFAQAMRELFDEVVAGQIPPAATAHPSVNGENAFG